MAQVTSQNPGERIAKVLARAGVCSRREAERWIEAGRISVDGTTLTSPAINITPEAQVCVDGQLIPATERARLWRYHKPPGLLTTHSDPQGRKTVFANLPDELPRVVSIGRLDVNSEGLLLLTNDGGLARKLELPSTGWVRRYRVRAFGSITQDDLGKLAKGITVDGTRFGAIEAKIERKGRSNVWIGVSLREGKNREVRRALEATGLKVNRLIRVSYGPFHLGKLGAGKVEEVTQKVMSEQFTSATKPKHKPTGAATKSADKGKPRRSGADRRRRP